MQIYTDIKQVDCPGPTILTIGNFDGVHHGHQALLHKLTELAAVHVDSKDGPQAPKTALLTFDPHPFSVLRPAYALRLLTTPQERLELAGDLGIDLGIRHPFTHETASLSPRSFMTLLKSHTGLTELVIGPDFALGRNRAGDVEELRLLGQELGYGVTVIDQIDWHGKTVRSSRIRHLLEEGNVSEVADLLGRIYHATGEVVEGNKIGRTLGIPTANLKTAADKLLPADGVYATHTYIGSSTDAPCFNSVTNLGMRPTVNGKEHRFETHLLDFPPVDQPVDQSAAQSGDLYGQELRVDFIARLRDEQPFSGIDALVAQIQADIVKARQILAS